MIDYLRNSSHTHEIFEIMEFKENHKKIKIVFSLWNVLIAECLKNINESMKRIVTIEDTQKYKENLENKINLLLNNQKNEYKKLMLLKFNFCKDFIDCGKYSFFHCFR